MAKHFHVWGETGECQGSWRRPSAKDHESDQESDRLPHAGRLQSVPDRWVGSSMEQQSACIFAKELPNV